MSRKPITAPLYTFAFANVLAMVTAFLLMAARYDAVYAFRFHDARPGAAIRIEVELYGYRVTGPNLTPLLIPVHNPDALASYLNGLRQERGELRDVRLSIADGLSYEYAIFIADSCMRLGFRTSLDAL